MGKLRRHKRKRTLSNYTSVALVLGTSWMLESQLSIVEAATGPTASVNGSTLTLGNYNGWSYMGSATPSDFTVLVNGQADIVSKVTFTNPSGTDSLGNNLFGEVDFTLSATVVHGDTVTVSYAGSDSNFGYYYNNSQDEWVPSFSESVTNNTPALLSGGSIGHGTSNGTTQVIATVPSGDTLVYTIGNSPTSTPDVGASAPQGATAYTSGADIPITAGAYLDVYELNAGFVDAFEEFSVTSSDIMTNAATPTMITQPTATQTVQVGDTNPSLSVAAAVGDGGTLSYQWYSNTTNSTTGGSAINGATTSTYSAPTTNAGITYYYVVITNTNNGVTGSRTASVTTNVAQVTVNRPVPPPLYVSPSFSWNGQYGVPYNALQLQAVSGQGPYVWSMVSGSLPSGLALSGNGVISGTPTGPDGISTFTVQVTDASGATAKQRLSITIFGAPSLAMTTASLPAGSEGKGYSVQLGATGISPPNWSVESGILPNGLSLNAAGLLSGAPLESGQFNFTVQVTDASGSQVQRTLSLAIQALGSSQRIVKWDGDTKIVPAVVQNNTTYMPIWYVMQWLKSMGIQSTWDGQGWNLTTQSQPDLSNLQAGNGHKDIYLNGTLVQKVDSVVDTDPSTVNRTTYMPIWYVMQLLNRVGLQSNWDGTTWTVTK